MFALMRLIKNTVVTIMDLVDEKRLLQLKQVMKPGVDANYVLY